MKITTKLKKYLVDSVTEGPNKLVGLATQYDYSLKSSLSWAPTLKVRETPEHDLAMVIGINLEDGLTGTFNTFIDLIDYLNVGLDITPPENLKEPEIDTTDLQMIDMMNGNGDNRVPYREVELVISDKDSRWTLDKEIVKLGDFAKYTKLQLKYKPTLDEEQGIVGEYTPGDIQFTFLLTETTSDLYSMFTPIFKHTLTPLETSKVLQLVSESSFSLISAELHTQEDTATSNLYPIGEAFGMSYSPDNNELTIGSLAGVIYIPMASIQNCTVEKLHEVANSRGYVINIKINHGDVKLLMMEN